MENFQQKGHQIVRHISLNKRVSKLEVYSTFVYLNP